MYSVQLFYGEDIGCDDLDTPMDERRVKMMGVPVGCLGEGRVIFSGTIADLLSASLQSQTINLIDNPPTDEQVEKMNNANGEFFGVGTDAGIKRIKTMFNENL